MVFGQLGVVDAIDHGDVGAIGRCRHQHALRTRRQVRRCLVLRRENARALHRDIDAERRMRQLRRVLDRRDLDLVATDDHVLAFDLHLGREAAMHRVEAQQVRVGFHRTQVVDGDDIDVIAARLHDGPKHKPANAAKPVDGNFDGHGLSPGMQVTAAAARHGRCGRQ